MTQEHCQMSHQASHSPLFVGCLLSHTLQRPLRVPLTFSRQSQAVSALKHEVDLMHDGPEADPFMDEDWQSTSPPISPALF